VWFRRGRLLIVSPDSLGTACPLSGRNSTYRPVQISETSSEDPLTLAQLADEFGISRERARQIEVSAFEKVQNAVKHSVVAMETSAPLPVRIPSAML
jgi:hypothetical protein